MLEVIMTPLKSSLESQEIPENIYIDLNIFVYVIKYNLFD